MYLLWPRDSLLSSPNSGQGCSICLKSTKSPLQYMFLKTTCNGSVPIPAMSLSTTPWNKPVPKVLGVYNLHCCREHVALHCSSKRIIWCCWSCNYSLLLSYITLVHSDWTTTSLNRRFFWKVSLFIFIAISLKIIALEHCATKLFYTFIFIVTSTQWDVIYIIFSEHHMPRAVLLLQIAVFKWQKG